ncbi:MAG: hypothetical protein K9L31_01230 [Candidatus Pacebacteria bacterium]|nr:hypothetical protein [Candidatus Paceibacterota bacterium]
MNIIDRGKSPSISPESGEMERLMKYFLNYRGRIRMNRKDNPKVTIIAKVIDSHYMDEEDCVVLVVDVYNDEPQHLFYYMGEIRNYQLSGVVNFSQRMSKFEEGDYDPVSVRFLK